MYKFKVFSIIFVSFAVIIFLSSLSQAGDSTKPTLGSGIELANIVEQANLLHRLIESGIQIYVSNDGTIYYPDEYRDLVKSIISDKNYSHHAFPSNSNATIFIALLELHEIPYSVINSCETNRIRVFYEIKYKEVINKEIEPKFLEASRKGIKINIK